MWLLVLLLVTASSSTPTHLRVWGGIDAEEAEFPYQISLRFLNKHLCGGSIIDQRTVLTAAHCLSGVYGLTVVVGTNQVSNTKEEHRVERNIVHGDFSPVSKKNDIAIVTLERNLNFNDRIQPIPLETNNIDDPVDCVLTGWGKYHNGEPDMLQKLTLKTIRLADCRDKLSNNGYVIYNTNICTLTKDGEGSCTGDSGGPLASNGKLIGIVSWGIPCAVGFPDVFTKVSSYIDWIKEHRY